MVFKNFNYSDIQKKYGIEDDNFNVNALRSIFEENTTFLDAEIRGEANFKQVSFISDANFNGVKFQNKVSFQEATFAGIADFLNALFNDYANYFGVRFTGKVSFNEAEFRGYSCFNDAILKEESFFILT